MQHQGIDAHDFKRVLDEIRAELREMNTRLAHMERDQAARGDPEQVRGLFTTVHVLETHRVHQAEEILALKAAQKSNEERIKALENGAAKSGVSISLGQKIGAGVLALVLGIVGGILTKGLS